MSNIEIIQDFIEEMRSFELSKDTVEIVNALEDILAEREQKDKRIKELEEENRIFALEGSRVVLKLYIEENYIPKQKVKDVLQNNRNELFSTTYINDEQYKPYTMQIKRINKIENELLEDK